MLSEPFHSQTVTLIHPSSWLVKSLICIWSHDLLWIQIYTSLWLVDLSQYVTHWQDTISDWSTPIPEELKRETWSLIGRFEFTRQDTRLWLADCSHMSCMPPSDWLMRYLGHIGSSLTLISLSAEKLLVTHFVVRLSGLLVFAVILKEKISTWVSKFLQGE